MSNAIPFQINVSEEFPKLPHAPIVEAVLELRAQSDTLWEETAMRARLETLLPDYEYVNSQREYEHELALRDGQLPQQQFRDLGFKGLRLRSRTQPQVAVFLREKFVFGRMMPYESWKQFKEEAMRLWGVHRAIAEVSRIDRIGLRYINRIPFATETVQIEDYLNPHPDCPRGLELPYADYLQRDTFDVPGHPYGLTVIRTIQRLQDQPDKGPGFILDIDAFTKPGACPLDGDTLNKCLTELRWLKNKAFLGSVTEKALLRMKGSEV